ncbi:MAG: DUF3006 domain-containing protein [Oscillospiraceae bacterium]|jgi:hypothetical protein|nr:DUF3006 domain-containing protein [Oscillospiraceae bacterium]
MIYIIDRFEEDTAVCEYGDKRLNLPRSLLPENAKEGDVIQRKNSVWRIDEERTVKRRELIAEKMRKLGF